LPDNLQFVLEDVNQGLPYPDGHFTVLHSRLMLAGVRPLFSFLLNAEYQIRDWNAYIKECVRLVKPGGLLVFVEMSDCFKLAEDLSREEQDKIAPAYAK
jgi:SAM-dependent methyltransferase